MENTFIIPNGSGISLGDQIREKKDEHAQNELLVTLFVFETITSTDVQLLEAFTSTNDGLARRVVWVQELDQSAKEALLEMVDPIEGLKGFLLGPYGKGVTYKVPADAAIDFGSAGVIFSSVQ